MNSQSLESNDREARLEQVLAEYVLAIESGQAPDHESLLQQHADLADDLRSFFNNRAAVERMTAPLKCAVDEATIVSLVAGEDDKNGRVRYFGDYELIDELGRGGMGVVFKARQSTLNRFVALKMILTGQLASPADVQRFKQEAEAAANLDHPHIAPIYETGEHQGQHYFSMKLIEGRSLRDALPELRRDSKGIRQAIKLLTQVSRAVHHAHQRGVLHRDLKPANILLDRNDLPYITDFGLAKRVEGGSDVTRTGAIVGTPSYMAPEQASGTKQISTAVDVYSLGAILYEVLTGQPPFRGSSPIETLMQVASSELIAPRSINRNASRDLETIALKCLEKDTAARYDSASALADDLERWLNDEPIRARRNGIVERSIKWARRRPTVAVLLAMIVVLVISSQIIIAWQWRQTFQAFTRGEGLRLVAQSEVVRPVNPGLALALAMEAAKRHPGLAANNALLGALSECREQHTLIGHEKPVTYAEFSPDGSSVLTVSKDQTVRLWNASTGHVSAVLKNGSDRVVKSYYVNNQAVSIKEYQQQEMLVARFSPDSRRIVTISSNCTARVWEVASGHLTWTLQGPVRDPKETYMAYGDAGGACVAWSPDSSHLAVTFGDYGHPDYSVRIWNLATGTESGQLTGHLCPVQQLEFSPDGRTIATASRDRTARLWDVVTSTVIHRLEGHRVGVAFANFSPDGKRLVTTGDGNEWIYSTKENNISYSSNGDRQDRFGGIIWDVATGKRISSLDWPERTFSVINPRSFSPDGSQLLTLPGGSYSGNSEFVGQSLLWNILTGQRKSVLKQSAGSGKVAAAQFSSDGKHVILAQKLDQFVKGKSLAVSRWDTMKGQRLEQTIPLHGHADEISSAVFSSDGNQLITASADSTARIWDVTPDGEFTIGQGHFRKVASARLTPDGSRLLTIPYRDDEESHRLVLTEVATKRELNSWALEKSDRQLSIIDISRDGKRALIAESHGSTNSVEIVGNIALWNLVTGRQEAKLGRSEEKFVTVSLSPDGTQVFAGGYEASPSRIWGVTEANCCQELRRFPDRKIWYGQFSPDGNQLLTSARQPGSFAFQSAGTLDVADIWDGASATLLKTFKDLSGTVRSDLNMSWSPNGKRVLVPCAGDTIARIWDVTSNTVAVELKGHSETITCGQYNYDGTRVATASQDKTVRIWNASSGTEITRLRGHEDTVRALVFSPDGKLIATTGDDQLTRLWNVSSGQAIASYPGTADIPKTVKFAGDGRWIMTVSYSECQFWPVDPLATAMARQPRELTTDERAKFEAP